MQNLALLLAFLTVTSVIAEKPDSGAPPPAPGAGIQVKSPDSGKNSTKAWPTASTPSAAKSTGSAKGAGGESKTNGTKGSPMSDGPLKSTQTAGVVGPLSQRGGLVSIAGLGIAFAVFM